MKKDNAYTYLRHSIQCNCEREELNFFSRSFQYLLNKPQFASCKRAQHWLSLSHPPPRSKSSYKSLVLSSLTSSFMKSDLIQIEKDLLRTYPDEPYFSSAQGKGALQRCLNAYTIYESSIGYVQGMNFIMASLLWHASESDAFWIFVGLMEDYELRDTYLPKLPGLSKHCQILQLLSFDCLPDVHRKLSEHSINFEMFAAEWCFTLFGSIIPVSQMHNIIQNFLKHGWVYFYRFVLVFLTTIQKKILNSNDYIDILSALKIPSQKEWTKFLADYRTTWRDINKRAFAIDIDDQYISYLHRCFSLDTAQFALKTSKLNR